MVAKTNSRAPACLIIGVLLTCAVVLIAYQPAWNGKPIWDDDGHITKSELRSVSGLARIWIAPGATQQYYPVVHSVFWLAFLIWGNFPLGYHLINILLHILSALLLVKILRFLSVPFWTALLAGALFALHPVAVESVAWISELKNTLSGVFFLAAANMYLHFDRERKHGLYAVALGLFVLGLLSKSVVVTLPFTLLILVWWKRRKIDLQRDIVPLVPFFVFGFTAGLFTLWMEKTFIIGTDDYAFRYSIIERCLIAGRAFWFYLYKIIWPANMVFIYPRWNISQNVAWQYLFPAAALFLAGYLWKLRHRLPACFAVFLYFFITLFPALGFFNVYPFRFSFVADHFQYLAIIGPIVLFAAAINSIAGLFSSAKSRAIKPLVFAFFPIALAILTWKQSGLYADSDVLYRTTIAKNPSCWMAHNNLGNLLLQRGCADSAIYQFNEALKIRPDYLLAAINLGIGFMQSGRTAEGIAQYEKALAIDSTSIIAYINLGNAYMQAGLTDKGIAQYRKVITLDSTCVVAYYDLGNAFMQTDRALQGVAQYQKALTIDPSFAAAHINIGRALMEAGRLDEAIAHFRTALKLDPALILGEDLEKLLRQREKPH